MKKWIPVLPAAIVAVALLVFAVIVLSSCGVESDASDSRFTPQQITVKLMDGQLLNCVQAVRNGGLSCDWAKIR